MRGTVDAVTSDLTAADRPIPDDADLRLITELINNVSIPLANAAWNAQMSQAEAALRLVSMAERGLPLRLVADGDRTALWHLAQAGPAADIPAVPEPADIPAVPEPETPAAVDIPVAAGDPLAAPSAEFMTEPAASTPFESAIPLHAGAETAQSGESAPSGPETPAAEPEILSAPEPAIPAALAEPEAPAAPAEPELPVAPLGSAAATPQSLAPAPWAVHQIAGPAGEQLAITILQVTDPAPGPIEIGGAPLAPGYRAVLVRSRLANTGQVPYPAGADANLVLETDQRVLIGRAGPPPAGHPGFAPGVAPGETAEGWSLFAVPESTVLAGIKWCIRPDFPATIVGWPLPN